MEGARTGRRRIGKTLLRQDGRTYTIGSSASLRWVGKDRQLPRPSAHPSATEQVLAGASRSPFSASAGTKVYHTRLCRQSRVPKGCCLSPVGSVRCFKMRCTLRSPLARPAPLWKPKRNAYQLRCSSSASALIRLTMGCCRNFCLFTVYLVRAILKSVPFSRIVFAKQLFFKRE